MAGWDTLGAVLGDALGGGTGEAYAEGRLRTAQTENALSNARLTQLKATAAESEQKARENLRSHAAELGIDPRTLEIMDAGLGSEFHSAMQGNEIGQSMGFRDVVADPNTPNNVRQYNLAAISGKPFSPLEPIGEGAYTDITAANPSLTVSPIGQATIGAKNAQAEADRARAAKTQDEQAHPERYNAGLAGLDGLGIKVPGGYMANPNFDGAKPAGVGNELVVAIPGGPNDVNTPVKLTGPTLAQFMRVINAANNTTSDLSNITQMPFDVNAGWLGGKSSLPNILGVTPEALPNTLTPESVQQYKAVTDSLSEQLATIERLGIRGAAGLARQFDRLTIMPGDSVDTVMFKLAQMRQSVENGMETLVSMNSLPPDSQRLAQQLLGQLKTAIPFTPGDVLALRQSKNPRMTLADQIKQQKLTAPVTAAPAAPTATPVAPGAPNADGWIEMNGVRVRRKPQ